MIVSSVHSTPIRGQLGTRSYPFSVREAQKIAENINPAASKNLRIALVGPLPLPSGGMANQTRQLAHLLEQEGVDVEIVQTNAPYRPRWIRFFRSDYGALLGVFN